MSLLPRLRPLSAALLALIALPGTALAEPADPDTAAGIRILNGISTQAVVFNPLTANPEANALLTQRPLKSETFAYEPVLREPLRHENGRTVLKYLVECALQPGQPVVSWYNPERGISDTASGLAGLCPEWASQGIQGNGRCRELVSACVLARNNAAGESVDMLMRGEDWEQPFLFNPTATPHVWSPLLLPATAGSALGGLAPEVGWRGESVGTCVAGFPVTLGAGAYPSTTCSGTKLGEISGDRILRVCAYPSDCTGTGKLAETDRSPCTIAPLTTFTCPASGQYSVMSAPYSRSATTASWVRPAAMGTGALSYPYGRHGAYSAFGFREGAFFGDIFDPAALAIRVSVSLGGKLVVDASGLTSGKSVYGKMFACHGKSWSTEAALRTRRLCANEPYGSKVGCAATALGPCEPGSSDTRAPRCDTNDGTLVPGDGDFEGCKDPSARRWTYPVTTFLRSACDTLPASQQQVCTQQCAPICYPTHCTTQCTTTCRPKTSGECLQ